jgi:hypothetical protein
MGSPPVCLLIGSAGCGLDLRGIVPCLCRYWEMEMCLWMKPLYPGRAYQITVQAYIHETLLDIHTFPNPPLGTN